MLFGAGLLLFGAVAVALYAFTRVALPPASPLAQTTFVYDAGGHKLTSYQVENRTDVPLSAVPAVVSGAVISTEDRHFYSEGAINPLDILRAFISDLRGSGSLQGGSTITQQYVKQAYLTSQRTLTRKVKEAAIAIKLGHERSKAQILDDYLNTIYFGREAYGVQAASEAYFGKPVERDGIAEASLLAGLIREPVDADPAHDPALARRNQTATLRAMVRDHRISEAQAEQVEATPFASYVLPPSDKSAVTTPVPPGDDYFLAAVRQELLARLPASEVDGGGLRVTTTLDPTLQAEAYDTVYGSGPDALHPSKGDPAGALVSVDANGQVRAMVGGAGYGAGYSGDQVNLAEGAEGGGSGRQAGSTFKAFMLAYLVKQGYSVESAFPAPPQLVVPHGNADGTAWQVSNFEGESGGNLSTLVDAMAKSLNTVYAQVVLKLGPANLSAMAESLGIPAAELGPPVPAEVLGTPSVSPLQMAAAYATFANGGVYTSPQLITKVTTADGTPVPWPARTTRQVLTPAQAALVTYVLQQVVTHGTGTAAGGLGTPVAGKTGTTENSANAWFIGYTPRLTTAVWMGFVSGEKPMSDLRLTSGRSYVGSHSSIQGGDVPADLFHTYMARALKSEVLGGAFPPVPSLGSRVLTPPPASTLQFPEGMGSTTTTPRAASSTTTGGASASTSSTSATSTATSTARPAGSTTTPTVTPTTRAARPSSTTATTAPPSTAAPPTTAAAPTTAGAG
ncbi:MAG TPA: transglycosylase domain-containing protein [Acidimicrobiales bacterium]|nr:transglycosylase domain-containing protein [Acidimicrobiales bacterium]